MIEIVKFIIKVLAFLVALICCWLLISIALLLWKKWPIQTIDDMFTKIWDEI